MHNNSWEKPYLPSQKVSIEIQDSQQAYDSFKSTERIIEEISSRISNIMLPFYDKCEKQNGKVLGSYPVLKFPTSFQTQTPMSGLNSYSFQSDTKIQKVNYREISNRYQQKQKLLAQSNNQRKNNPFHDQRDNRSDDDIFSEENTFNNKAQEIKKLEKARKHYEKLTRQLKSNKRMKRKFKDKNRPKKAKSGYNLFVQDVVPQIKSENPSFSAPDLVRVAAKMYNQLTEQEKVPYQRRYLLDKQRFQRERQAYFKKNPEMDYRMDSKQKANYMNSKQYKNYAKI